MVYVAGHNITGPYGGTTESAFRGLLANESMVQVYQHPSYAPVPVPLARISPEVEASFSLPAGYSRLEGLLIHSIRQALSNTHISPALPDTLLIFATTKGNIDKLSLEDSFATTSGRLNLYDMAATVAGYFGSPNRPIVVSTACTSGVAAIVFAQRMLNAGHCRHAIVTGGDLVSPFVTSGFHSFQALSNQQCRPFDRDRNGINLGEGCATLILTSVRSDIPAGEPVRIDGGATTNDANHISGPSRTGDGLYNAIRQAMAEASVTPADIGYISAHGTATPYNDEMESKAFELAGVQNIEVNSMKAYIGHTLGAAGIMETVLAIRQMQEGRLVASLGFENTGTSVPLAILRTNQSKSFDTLLKTSSGFGGCNAALVVRKEIN